MGQPQVQGAWRSGSASRLHRVGRGFESLSAHHLRKIQTPNPKRQTLIRLERARFVTEIRLELGAWSLDLSYRFFPDRHDAFHFINQPLASCKCLSAMRRYYLHP